MQVFDVFQLLNIHSKTECRGFKSFCPCQCKNRLTKPFVRGWAAFLFLKFGLHNAILGFILGLLLLFWGLKLYKIQKKIIIRSHKKNNGERFNVTLFTVADILTVIVFT